MKTILLVDDDPASLITLTLILRSHGYDVLESGDSEDAINVCLEHQGPIELLLIAFELGGCNAGPQLAEWLLELSPEMQVVFLFCSPPSTMLEAATLPGGCTFLRKPVHPEELLTSVQHAIGTGGRAGAQASALGNSIPLSGLRPIN